RTSSTGSTSKWTLPTASASRGAGRAKARPSPRDRAPSRSHWFPTATAPSSASSIGACPSRPWSPTPWGGATTWPGWPSPVPVETPVPTGDRCPAATHRRRPDDATAHEIDPQQDQHQHHPHLTDTKGRTDNGEIRIPLHRRPDG